MRLIQARTITEAYSCLVNAVITEGEKVGDTREIQNCIVEIANPHAGKILFTRRKISDEYMNAELQWYWSGDNSCKNIGSYAKMWLRLTDDGETNNSAYGYIIQNKFGRDQLKEIIELLRHDPNSRRAVLNISDPFLDKEKTKDYQCTIALQFLVRKGELHETVFMRSNDIILGFPYDYCFFVSVGQYIADELNLRFVKYTHHATSMHLYDRDCKKIVSKQSVGNFIDMKKIRSWYETKEKLKEKSHEN